MRKVLLYGFLGLFALLQLFPLLWLGNFSLLKAGEFFGDHILKWPSPPQWINYQNALKFGKVVPYFAHSVVVAVVTVLLTALLALTMGYAFTRMRWKFRNVVLNLILIGMMIPLHATLLPNFVIFHKIGLTDKVWALILPNVAFNLPVSIFIVTGFLQTLPKELEEAAIMDGCSVLRMLFSIIRPLAMNALSACAVMTFIATWNEFIMANTYLMTESWKTLPFSIIQFTGQYSSNYGAQFAVMTIAAVPSILFYLLFTEQMKQGVMSGTIK
ncbi:MAG TPA: carbohydrate ABC transporter permease [Symbiobacteriaceae bacterium]|nr:carbohydrate ABC transporter permease [Symbiobacteriaceae bacterium]